MASDMQRSKARLDVPQDTSAGDPACAVTGPFIIVMNAGSGRQEAAAAREAVSAVLQAAGRDHDFWVPPSPAGLADMADKALAEAKRCGGAVVAAGGDGTINTVAGVLLGSGCPLGLLPQGTFNYFGRAHGVPQEPADAARSLLRARVEPVQVGQVNGQIFLVNASLGLYPQLLEDRESYTAQFGRSRLVAFAGAIMTLLRWRGQIPLRLQTRAGIETVRTTTLFVGNNYVQLERLGLPEAEAVKAGLLAVMAVRPLGPRAMLGLLLRGLLGRLGDASNVDSFAVQRLWAEPRGIRRIKVAVDGEVMWMRSPLLFEVAPQPLLLMVPHAADQAPVQ